MAYLKMSNFSFQQSACEETRVPIWISDTKDPVVCPKPRRVGVLANNPIRPPLRWHMSHESELSDHRAGAELLDLILIKEGYGAEQSASQAASSPPYFLGSPPCRAANSLIQDAQFGDEKHPPVSAASPSSIPRKGGCARVTFGLKPPPVRVEGFDCLNSSIPTMA